MYGLPSAAAWSIRRRHSSRTLAYSSPSAVTQPCSAMTLTTFRPASADRLLQLGDRPPCVQIFVDLVVPGLDRLVARRGRRPGSSPAAASAGSCWCSGSRRIRSSARRSVGSGVRVPSIRCSIGGRDAIGQVDHAGVVGDVQARVEVEDVAVDLAARGRGEEDDRGADVLGRRQVADARRGNRAGRSAAWISRSPGVSTQPGATMLQVIPRLRHSTATCRVRPSSPALLMT